MFTTIGHYQTFRQERKSGREKTARAEAMARKVLNRPTNVILTSNLRLPPSELLSDKSFVLSAAR